MEKSVLPLHDVPLDRPKKNRSPARPAKRPRPLDRRIAAALADPSQVLFLDVETTGLSWFYDELTIVGWAIDDAYRLHIAGTDPEPLLSVLRKAQTLITFNGTLFDLRFLRKTFGDIQIPPVHIDFRYLAKRAGLVGGQKAIERELKLPKRVGRQFFYGTAICAAIGGRYLA